MNTRTNGLRGGLRNSLGTLDRRRSRHPPTPCPPSPLGRARIQGCCHLHLPPRLCLSLCQSHTAPPRNTTLTWWRLPSALHRNTPPPPRPLHRCTAATDLSLPDPPLHARLRRGVRPHRCRCCSNTSTTTAAHPQLTGHGVARARVAHGGRGRHLPVQGLRRGMSPLCPHFRRNTSLTLACADLGGRKGF